MAGRPHPRRAGVRSGNEGLPRSRSRPPAKPRHDACPKREAGGDARPRRSRRNRSTTTGTIAPEAGAPPVRRGAFERPPVGRGPEAPQGEQGRVVRGHGVLDAGLAVERSTDARLEPPGGPVPEAARRQNQVDLLGAVVVVGVADVGREQRHAHVQVVAVFRTVRTDDHRVGVAFGPARARMGAAGGAGRRRRRSRRRTIRCRRRCRDAGSWAWRGSPRSPPIGRSFSGPGAANGRSPPATPGPRAGLRPRWTARPSNRVRVPSATGHG